MTGGYGAYPGEIARRRPDAVTSIVAETEERQT
jgi:hypothetical protein